MSLFGEKYGSLGFLSRASWKKLLASNSDLFKHRSDVPKGVIGPTFSSNSNYITGDMMSMENFVFASVASDSQQKFYSELLASNHSAAVEYMLTISGAIIAWKKDMVDLQQLLDSLSKSEKLFDAEEHFLEAEKKLIHEEENFEKVKVESLDVLDTLKKHLPDMVSVLKDISVEKIIAKDAAYLDQIGVDRLIRIIELVEKQIREREDILNAYIKKMKSEYSFLFE